MKPRHRLLPLISILLLTPTRMYGQWNIANAMEAGKSALEYHDYQTSIAFFNRVIDARPTAHIAYYFRGIAKARLDDFMGSEQDLSATISLNPYYYEAYDQRGTVRFQLEKYGPAAEDFQTAVQLEDKRPELWSHLVLCELKNGNYALSDSLASLMWQRWPEKAEGYLLASQAKYGLQDDAASERLIDQAVEKEPFNISALTVKANFLMKAGRWDEAIAMYTRTLHIHPKNAQALICRGLCHFMGNNRQTALSDFHLAADISPENPLVIRCSQGSDNELKAIEQELVQADDFVFPESLFYINHAADPASIIEKYDLLPPQYLSDFQKEAYRPDDSFTLGYQCLFTHGFMQAISALTETIEKNPHIPEAYFNRSFAYAKSNSPDKAISDLSRAIAERSAYAEAYYNRAILRMRVNDLEGARLDFSKAGELGIAMAYQVIQEMNIQQ